eukprot:CAMPEP_0116892036 /NCGR_PEP_ID=MMETSP0467-20121206/2334_1 /TAXON_ID=283647 /ORGANISM="Mesodinium pulex, Strain SPMC105" /LENGTH=84 /DNA_ID=CAMNT_0004560913 /DNA_START=503 /DNA_END=757 /DNA_ORIENTATION=-
MIHFCEVHKHFEQVDVQNGVLDLELVGEHFVRNVRFHRREFESAVAELQRVQVETLGGGVIGGGLQHFVAPKKLSTQECDVLEE